VVDKRVWRARTLRYEKSAGRMKGKAQKERKWDWCGELERGAKKRRANCGRHKNTGVNGRSFGEHLRKFYAGVRKK